MQEFTSKDTSLNQVCKIYKNVSFPKGARILDYGGGAYDKGVEYMANKGVKVSIYDKYNRSAEHNETVLKEFEAVKPDYVVCANVLNVIKEDFIIEEILQDIKKYGVPVFFCMYEGNRTGKGQPTKKGYQRNEKTSQYFRFLTKFFDVVKVKNGIVECK